MDFLFLHVQLHFTINQYDFIRKILAKNTLLEHKYSGLCAYYRYNNYSWTLERIDKSDRLDFLKRFALDFKQIIFAGEFDSKLFSSYDINKILQIIYDPEYFYYYHYDCDTVGRYNLHGLEDKEKVTILKKWLANADKDVSGTENINSNNSNIKEFGRSVDNNKRLKQLTRELADIKSGYSFRIGRIITYIPRKLLGRK